MLTDGGVTERPRGDFAGDYLTRVQADAQPQLDAVASFDVGGEPLCLLLDGQGGQARAYRVVLQRRWCAEHRHDAVAGEAADRAFVAHDH